MNTKTISKLIAFVVTFALSVTVAGFFKPDTTEQARKITALLTQDISNGTERRNEYHSFNDVVSATEVYVSSSESIDYSGLPADFTNAWLAHMQAWRTHSDSLAKFQSKYNPDIHFHGNGSVTGEFHSVDPKAFREFSLTERREVREINQTWYKVLRLAQKYGAEIPANALD